MLVVKRFPWLVPTIAALLIVGGGYVLLLAAAPLLPAVPLLGLQEVDVAKSLDARPGTRGDRLYIPQIGVDVAIVTGDDARVLDQGAWHRQPQNGNPERGGNFVLSAHRFVMGWTPQTTRNNSPFYRIDQLRVGDEFYVDYHGLRYSYVVSRLYPVAKTAVEIEGPSDTAKMTLYSCDIRGAQAGRMVVEALPK